MMKIIVALSLIGGIAAIAHYIIPERQITDTAAAITTTDSFYYTFNTDGTLHEVGQPAYSSSRYWWLNSGGRLILANGLGSTMQGDAPLYDRWRLAYAASNPLDTDGGRHPQNLFRLIQRQKVWENSQQDVAFRILNDNLSPSPNRNSSNGVLLMSRYGDGNNLYYGGVRVDGYAIIKKKARGIYTTLASEKIFTGIYNPISTPNLIPHNRWIGLRFITRTQSNGSVELSVWLDDSLTGSWRRVAYAIDAATPVHKNAGYTGIRSDFMDVQFDDYRITPP
jgi:hypothetical protein